MRMVLKLGGKSIDTVSIPEGMETNKEYISAITKVLLDRNEPIIRISHKTPECVMEADHDAPTPFSSSLPPHQRYSEN
jgi:hypothetical protein